MAEKFLNIKQYYGGISDSIRQGPKGSYQFGQSINFRDEATEFKLTPVSVKVSGSVVTDLIKWIVDGLDGNLYFYGDTGNIYREDAGGSWSLIHTVPNSKGQGMDVYSDYIYYSWNTGVGRYGPLTSGSPSFTDTWASGYQDTTKIGFAPVKAFSTGLAIGNGRYVSWFDGSVIPTNGTAPQLAALTKIPLKPTGENVRSLEIIDEYLAIGTQRGNGVLSNEYGSIYYWDGASVSWNYFVSTDNGAVNALGNSNNRLFSLLGSSSSLYINYRPFQRIQRMPKIKTRDYCEVYPGAVTTWQNLIHFGSCANTNSTNLYQGIYSWGSTGQQFPEALSFDYPISTGTVNSTSVSIGSCKGLGNYLYFGWKDGASYGVDKVSASGNINTTGFYEALLFGDLGRDQAALTAKATHYPLLAGESVQVGYRLDRYSNFSFPVPANTTVGSIYTRVPMSSIDARFNEIELKVIITGPGTSTPTIVYVGVKFDDLPNESNDY